MNTLSRVKFFPETIQLYTNCSIKVNTQDVYKTWNLKKEVGIVIKIKQTSNQLEPVTRNIFCIGYTIITQSQMHAQITHSLVHLRDLIPILTAVFYIFYNSQSRD